MKKLGLIVVLVVLGWVSSMAPVSEAEDAPLDKVSSWVMAATAGGGETDLLVVLAEQANLSPAYDLSSKQARGRYVYDALWEVAQRSQAPLRSWLDGRGIPYQSYYIVNLLHIQMGDRALVQTLASRPEVARIEANPRIQNPLPERPAGPAPQVPEGIEWNISHVGAPAVWDMGYTGAGIVVGAQDTGYDWDHPALISQYRGWNGSSASHDYNWHDSVHSGGGTCGPDSPEPCDDHGHGTHTVGTVLGDDGGSNQIGMAPGAQWIGCRNMNQGVGSPTTYLECFEFFLAPYPVGGSPGQGNPDLAPDVTNNSWSCPPDEGCSWSVLQSAVEAQRAAGIMTVVSAGNEGSSCSTVQEPPGIYDASYSVGATSSSDSIASFSSRGPVTVDGSNRLKPDISAPGVDIRSSVPGGGYQGGWQGTSMAAPHVAGAVALIWSAQPALGNQVDQTEDLINSTAVPRYSTQCGDPPNTVPNNVYGWGRLDVLAAVQEALGSDDGTLEGEVTSAGDGAPIAGATVWAVSATSVHSTTTSGTGSYSITLAPVTYEVSAWRYGYGLETEAGVSVQAGASTHVPFTLTQSVPYSLTGCVSDAATGASLWAEILITGPFGAFITETLTSQTTGCYTLTVHGGTYTVTAEAPLHYPQSVLVPLDQHRVQDYALTAATTDGLLQGVITSQATGLPLAGAMVEAQPGGMSVESAADGNYQIQLVSGVPLTITVSAPLHSPFVDGGVVVPQSNILVRDYALPRPQMHVTPTAGISVTLDYGEKITRTLVISNEGPGSLQVEIAEYDLGIAGVQGDVLVVQLDTAAANAMSAALIDLGYVPHLVSDVEFQAMPVSSLLAYRAVFYAGHLGGTGMPGASESLLMSYLDAGGSLLIADNDLGYWRHGHSFYDSYLQASYLSDDPGINGLQGENLFEGLALDISADPFPDDFTVRAAGTRVLRFEGGHAAGVAVDQGGYRAVYLSFDFDHLAGAADRQAVVSRAMDYLARYEVDWLELDPTAGAVGVGDALSVSVEIDAGASGQYGVHWSQLQVTSNDPDMQPYLAIPITMTVIPPPPELALAKHSGVDRAEVGTALHYTLVVTNTGGPATGVMVTETLPGQLLFSWAEDDGVFNDDQVAWEGLDIPEGEVLTLSYGVTVTCVPSGTQIVNTTYQVTTAEWPTPTAGSPVTITAVAEGPLAAFEVTPPVIRDYPTLLINESQRATSYLWDFGDGGTSTKTNPWHQFTSSGTHSVWLQASNLCASDSTSLPVMVDDMAVTVQPPVSSGWQNPGAAVTTTLWVTNSGTLDDRYTLSLGEHGWSSLLSTSSLSLTAGQATTVTVRVEVPVDAAGGAGDSVVVTVQSLDDPRLPSASASATLTTTANVVYGVAIWPASAQGGGLPGQWVTYTLSVTNTSNVADTITLGIIPGEWATVLSTTTLSLPSDGQAEVELYVYVPPAAQGGTQDTAVIQAAGGGSGAEATVVTTAAPEYGVTMLSPVDARVALPGEIVSYTLLVTNTGNTTDTITLGRVALGWPTSVPSDSLTLAAGAWQDVSVWVTVPMTAPAGLQDEAVIRASGSDGFAEESLTTTAGAVYGVSLAPLSVSADASPGEQAVYTLVFTNTGNSGDVLTVSRVTPGWLTTISPTETTLERGGWQTLSITVTVPMTATMGMSETAVIRVSGSGDSAEAQLSTTCIWYRVYLPLLLMNSQ